MHPATTKWYDRRDYVYVEFCVADSKDVNVKFDKTKCSFSCVGGTESFRHENQINLFEAIVESESKHKRTDRSVVCYLRKAQPGMSWPRLTKDKEKLSWLSVDFNNWKDWAEDSEAEEEHYEQFSDDSDDEKMPDLE